MTDTAVFDESVAEEMAGLLDDIEERARPGDSVGEVDGVPITKTKTRSMVHRNGVDLPERTPVYDRDGGISYVPTAQLGHHLNKRNVNGEKAFHAKRQPWMKKAEPIDQTCEWCAKRGGKKVFYDIDDYEAHCEYLHPREWASKLRREAQQNNVTGVDGILKLLSNLSPEQREALLK